MSTTAYPHYPARTLLNLDGIHEFAFLGDGVPSLEKIDAAAIRYDDLMPVPGCFDASPRYAGKRGVAAYRITVELADESLLLLRLGALGLRGRILWDNTEIGIDELPYSQVEYEFESGPAGTHRLVLLIDNRLNFQDSPLFSVFYDFYGYGGIYRSLELFTLPQGSRFDRVRVITVDLATRRVRLEGRMAGGSTPLRLGFDSAEPQPVEPVWHGDRFELELTVPGGQLWTPAAPVLHTVRLESTSDAIVERFGIRTVTAARGQILLNGEPLRLYGYNRHDAHPQFGPAMPVELQIADLQLMRDLGCNFVRGCHYPQSQRFLDLCDQLGMLVWEESLGWGDRLEVQQDPKFRELQKIQTRRMVRNSCNHPSVILWGFMNEGGDNHETGESLMRELAAVIREEDRSRPLTMATMHIKESRCLDAYDVISFNTYPRLVRRSRRRAASAQPHRRRTGPDPLEARHARLYRQAGDPQRNRRGSHLRLARSPELLLVGGLSGRLPRRGLPLLRIASAPERSRTVAVLRRPHLCGTARARPAPRFQQQGNLRRIPPRQTRRGSRQTPLHLLELTGRCLRRPGALRLPVIIYQFIRSGGGICHRVLPGRVARAKRLARRRQLVRYAHKVWRP